MEFDYLHLYVDDYPTADHCYQHQWGFTCLNKVNTDQGITGIYQQGQILLLISAPASSLSQYNDYLQKHPPGIGEVAWQVDNWQSFQHQLTELQIETRPTIHPLTKAKGLTFLLWGDVSHSIYPVRSGLNQNKTLDGVGLTAIDHVVVNIAGEQFGQTSQWYQQIFGWSVQQSFTINTPHSGLYSEALASANGKVQFNLNCPTDKSSQIQTFLANNHGAGIQHVAFSTTSITQTIAHLQERGVNFLKIPTVYYQQQRKDNYFNYSNLDWDILQRLEILLDDQDDTGKRLLLQIFSQPCYGVGTLFWEIIERRHRAEGFGQGNFQALYEAVEALEKQLEVP
ncbi:MULTISPECIES: 4-hydroxyphenylpyruvate dioxygenase [unclassified Synechocystis]|uniref:4-hydroxyphenylpyruvate dioxygenase n=1 Tax=unclassified Synechocystis TaxID=2640012 RepID=UPI0004120875|nr:MULTISPECIES: 4-hydroxyphenylpyruvate dioxygenase [unclassified Synechocystis]AIE74709.1 4-hydroxyphenylpyruvate dioxygenase [Synechocystis sp. PCC 6714]MCT0253938.1 4-hydroxyphenylpyruvate dioxygenase [Synechocystis sp. CS-94]